MSGRKTGAFNIARADFDDMMLTEAVAAGARKLQPATVRQINHLRDGDVNLTLADGTTVQAQYLIDSTGQATLLGKLKKWRTAMDDSHLRKAAYFSHFTHVKRLEGENEGMPTIVMCKEGWFWLIPLNDTVTSVGIVLEPNVAKQINLPANQMLNWGIERSPLMRDRMRGAQKIATDYVRAEFSYRCAPYSAEGCFLAGDAAMFLDPVFSTGVCIGMSQGKTAAEHVIRILQKNESPAKMRKSYMKYVSTSTFWFRKLIRYYYEHPFRELFLQGHGPLQVHCAVITILAGHVYPRPEWKVRWRFMYFELCKLVQRYKPLAPRRAVYSLLDAQPEPL
jgi:flavin-dependent dehydrogenase